MTLVVSTDGAGQRLDQYLAAHLSEIDATEISRARVQQLIERGEVVINDAAAKASLRLKGDERITLTGPPHALPLRAIPEEIALDIVIPFGNAGAMQGKQHGVHRERRA